MKKKDPVTLKDKEDWNAFTENMGSISVKESDLLKENIQVNKVQKLDLHGTSLDSANKVVKEFILKSFNRGYKKLLIITGKGSRSKSYSNPYLSEKFSVLKNSIPEYINHDEDLSKKVFKISKAEIKDGGEGAIYIYLKRKKLENEL